MIQNRSSADADSHIESISSLEDLAYHTVKWDFSTLAQQFPSILWPGTQHGYQDRPFSDSVIFSKNSDTHMLYDIDLSMENILALNHFYATNPIPHLNGDEPLDVIDILDEQNGYERFAPLAAAALRNDITEIHIVPSMALCVIEEVGEKRKKSYLAGPTEFSHVVLGKITQNSWFREERRNIAMSYFHENGRLHQSRTPHPYLVRAMAPVSGYAVGRDEE